MLCGDPARALAIAQRVLTQPRMSNHHRGLWGYFGETSSGLEMTVQSTGIGGPSAAIVLGELADLGLRAAIRIGTCSALDGTLPLGTGVVVGSALACDGTSAALGSSAGAVVEPDDALTRWLSAVVPGAPVRVISRDVPPDPLPFRFEAGAVGQAEVADLQSAPLLVATRRLGIAAAVMLAVGASGGRRLEDEPLEARLLKLAEIGAEALEASGSARD
ncbi:MAG: hypothetical protein M3Q53_03405 [Actinomycetota bacterium]|nr:hypothetical protein [Actinomycetota bacterium]